MVKLLPAIDPVGAVKPIQGKTPDSIEEYRMSVALDKAGLKYDFQYPVAGGSRLRGGTTIDFLVHTAPLYTPLFVDGEYWHGGRQADQDAILRAKLVRVFRGAVRNPVSVAAGLLKTQAATDTIVRKLFG